MCKKTVNSEKKAMIVIASGERPVDEVAKDVREAGFQVDQVLQAIGQVTGRAAPTLKKRLKGIQGVADVTDTHEDFNIGSPGAPVSLAPIRRTSE
jgi:vacuolar-type H+-ATPase subunit I/STV1